ncbi:hypothetical protein D3C73_1610450 [compost metagenome]
MGFDGYPVAERFLVVFLEDPVYPLLHFMPFQKRQLQMGIKIKIFPKKRLDIKEIEEGSDR